MRLNDFFQSKSSKMVLLSVSAILVALLIFNFGMFIGFNKAFFSYRWGENYHKNFAGPKGGFFREFSGKDFIDSHGAFGQIINIGDRLIIIKGRDDIERIISLEDNPVIKLFRDTVKISDLKLNDYVVVIGEPDESGKIKAKLIRIMPSPQSKDGSYKFSPFRRMF